MENIKKLQPRAFTKFCMSIGMVPSSYTSALTYEEQLLWFCSYLEKEVIPAVNNNAEAVTELQGLYTQLRDYVDHYFDNLDVQEEINNKLDEMAESGQLTDIIAQYLQLAGVLAYDTKADMKAAENLVDGSITKTLGNTTYKDGQGSFYKVREILNTDTVDDYNIIALHDTDLIAERIPEKEDNYIFISDSYGAGLTYVNGSYTYIQGWCDYTKSYMGIPDDKYHKFCESGSGFKHLGNQGHTFLDLLQNGASSITDKHSITKIIVCGGGNDAFSLINSETTVSELNSLTQQFYNYCKVTFPEAKVYFGMITNFKAPTGTGITNRNALQEILKVYQYTCRFGGIYLYGVENIMHNYDEMFSDDEVHPYTTGYQLLGAYMAQAIQNGSVSTKFPFKRNNITFESIVKNTTTFALDNCLYNDETIISFNECNIDFNEPQTYGGSSAERKIIKIGKINLPYYRTDFSQLSQIPTRFYILNSSNQAYSGFGYVSIDEENNIWVDTSTVTSNPNDFLTPTDISRIHLYGGKVVVPTMYS